MICLSFNGFTLADEKRVDCEWNKNKNIETRKLLLYWEILGIIAILGNLLVRLFSSVYLQIIILSSFTT